MFGKYYVNTCVFENKHFYIYFYQYYIIISVLILIFGQTTES